MYRKHGMLTVAFFAAFSASASLNWRSATVPSGYTLKDADATLLKAGTTSTTGFFVQLIEIIGGVGILPATGATPTGAASGNVVVDVSFLGSNFGIGTPPDGILNSQGSSEPHVVGGEYFVRVWNAPAASSFGLGDGNEATPRPSMTAGLNALGKPLRFGDSVIFNTPGATNVAYTFDFQAVSNQLFPGAVPEPGTAGLLGLGLVLLRRTLRRRAS